MCGIIYSRNITAEGSVNKRILRQYFKQKSRGTDGYGFVATIDGKTIVRKAQYEAEIFREMKRCKSKEIIFHHRIPTSTDNTVHTAHPMSCETEKYRYHMVHNGVIHNWRELEEKHQILGIKYKTYEQNASRPNDSESLLHELVIALESGKKEIEAQGSLAFVMVKTDKEDNPLTLYFGRNGGYSPLCVDIGEDRIDIASELHGGLSLLPHVLHEIDYATNKHTTHDFRLEKLEVQSQYQHTSYRGKIKRSELTDDDEDVMDYTEFSDDAHYNFLALSQRPTRWLERQVHLLERERDDLSDELAGLDPIHDTEELDELQYQLHAVETTLTSINEVLDDREREVDEAISNGYESYTC